ncbi:hypothetical protein J8F10_08655 [Gemmata sp. G18]|uniref:Transposase IS4-like domain-containing protein n=1 Tax=Gemmata palustris TaxID=2822762 RepID=A0ABS5BR47_9BACT|nr:hypothetical protein [Gemmata palustris]MBP3955348.1 hypothetical protein [Gemmata palustris]
MSLLWTDGDRHIPCDYRIYNKDADAHQERPLRGHDPGRYARGFKPRGVVFDGWYSSLDNLKLIRNCGWVWLTRLKSNRLVNKDREGTRALEHTTIAATGTDVWLTGFGLVKVFGIATPDGGTAYWATNDLGMTDLTRVQLAEFSWAIEHYHRGSSNAPGSSGVSAERPAPSATTSGWPCARSYGSRRIVLRRASVGSKPKPRSFVRPCETRPRARLGKLRGLARGAAPFYHLGSGSHARPRARCLKSGATYGHQAGYH